MSETARSIDRGWLKSRLSRHLPEMLRLSVPAMTSRIGVMLLAFVDTMMVGRYSSLELAYLGAANGTVVVLILVVAIGLLMGVMISTANAYGRGDWAEISPIASCMSNSAEDRSCSWLVPWRSNACLRRRRLRLPARPSPAFRLI